MYKRIATTFGFKVATAASSFILVILLSQFLGASGKGEASLFLANIAFVSIFCNVIGGDAIMFQAPRNNISRILILSYVWSFIICTIFYLTIRFIDLPGVHYGVHLSILTFLLSTLTTNITVLNALKKFTIANSLSFLQVFLSLLIFGFYFFVTAKSSVLHYIVSLYTAYFICLLISFYGIYKNYIHREPVRYFTLLKESFSLGGVNQLSHLVQFLSARLTFYFLVTYLGSSFLGVFSNGVSLIESVLLVTNSFALIQYAEISNSADLNYAKEITLKMSRLSTVLCIILVSIMIILPASFYVWIFGNEFSEVKMVIYFHVPAILCYNICLILGHYFSGRGKYHISGIACFGGMIVTLALNFAFKSNYSLVTASMISAFSYIVISIIVVQFFIRETGVSIKELFPVISDFRKLVQVGSSFLTIGKNHRI